MLLIEHGQIQEESISKPPSVVTKVTNTSPGSEKIALFRDIFRGREDIFSRRWHNSRTGKVGYAPACQNEWVRGTCGKPQIKCGECLNQAFTPVTDDVIRSHLIGRVSAGSADFTVGIYPLLRDDSCWFVAVDFDKKTWTEDVRAFRDAARVQGVPVCVERSRSGNGAHAWIFFAESIAAKDARCLASFLLTEAMDAHSEIGFDSYDRLFPSQDTLPSGGFGNLIALPLQGNSRQDGNSVFLNDDFAPYEDQWEFLSSIERMSRQEVMPIIERASVNGQVLGVRLSLTDDGEKEPWTSLPSHRYPHLPIDEVLPERVEVVLGNQIFISRSNLPPKLVARLIRLAAFQNPEFYAAQAMRLSTFGKPRIISCAELLPEYLAIPRGCFEELLALFKEVGIYVELHDKREIGHPIGVQFQGELTSQQENAVAALLDHEIGVLSATTAFGKTVVAAKMIEARDRNTLILVHRRQLLEQWVNQLQVFLNISPDEIGVFYGAKKKLTGRIDVALMQSLVRKGVVSDLVAGYGHVVVDECHHISAVGFEAIARELKARNVLGLSATVTRKDGHHPIIFMQCGPIRYRVDARNFALTETFDHKVIFRSTDFRYARSIPDEKVSIQQLYSGMVRDPSRNELILNDIILALKEGRSPVVITERRDHLEMIASRLFRYTKNVVVLRGGLKAKELKTANELLSNIPRSEERVIVATGRYLGEGFDDARLDTLFLTMPISWRGVLAQYVGRLHRQYDTKRDVLVYDYVDQYEPMLVRMAGKRESGYRGLGYQAVPATNLTVH